MNLNKQTLDLVGESIDTILDKVFCTVVFTAHYVVKYFKDDYNEELVKYEYDWDKGIPLLDVKLASDNYRTIIMNRLPKDSNILYKLVNNSLTNEGIIKIGKFIKQITCTYETANSTIQNIYESYINNLNIQKKYLEDKVNLEQLNNWKTNGEIYDIFIMSEKIPKIVHGNMFSGNMFLIEDDVIVIDPLSLKHMAKHSFEIVDLATFLVDVCIFKSKKDYIFIKNILTNDFDDNEKEIFELYFLLKFLVRVRFAFLENELQDEYLKDCKVNQRIISSVDKVLGTYADDSH
jgi:hypothetical protein